MRILLDTHVVLALMEDSLASKHAGLAGCLGDPETAGYVSVASLWEMAIKTRLGKLNLGMPLFEVAGFADAAGLSIIAIETAHAVTQLEHEPETRDPFDRLLLAQCQIESLRLMTVDRALVSHPLALRVER